MQLFTNAPVDMASLPQAGAVLLQPVHQSYLRLLRIEWRITAVILTALSIGLVLWLPDLHTGYGKWIVMAGVVLLLGLYLLFQEASFPYRAYAVREHDVMYQRGWIVRSLKICPFNRIQNCTVQTGPLERRFGLATLTLFTAGSNSADMRIHGLKAEEADALRQYILEKITTDESGR